MKSCRSMSLMPAVQVAVLVSAGISFLTLFPATAHPADQPLAGIQAASAQPVYLVSSQTHFDSIQAAYTASASSDEIRVQGMALDEALLFNQDHSVTVIGGYDSSFTSGSGTPTAARSLTISAGEVTVENLAFQTVVAAPVPVPPIMGTIPSQSGTVGSMITPITLKSYATRTDGDPIDYFTITAGSLPPGLNFNALAGLIEGTPLTSGAYSTAVKARDKDGVSNATVIQWVIAAPAGAIPPIMGEVPEQNGMVGTAITNVNLADYVTRTNGDPITGYAITGGSLPPGLTLNTGTGEISGTPTTDVQALFGGAYIIQVTASDKDGASNAMPVIFVTASPMLLVAPDMSGVPASMTFDERMAALDKVDAQIKLIWTGTLDENRAALVAYIESLPEFADAGISADGTVWARFKDGRPASWLYRTATLPVPPPQMPVHTTAQSREAIHASPQAASASRRKAVLLDVDGLGRGAPAIISGWLNEAGYESGFTSGSIRDLMTDIKNVSVLHLDTHGMNTVSHYGQPGYYLATVEHYKSSGMALDQFIKTEYGKLMDMEYIQPGTAPSGEHYWLIGEKFIRKYWTFAADSFIFDDACELFLDPYNKTRFIQNLQALAKNKQISVVGWDNEVSAGPAATAAKLFYEFTLGRITTDVTFPLPNHRPFSVNHAANWMEANGKAEDPYEPYAKMHHYISPGASYTLMPSIQGFSLSVPPSPTSDWTLDVVSGMSSFGTVPGTLSVGGTPLTVPTGKWNTGEITAPIAAGLSGPVVVEIDGRKSNAVPLTLWTGNVKQTFIDSSKGGYVNGVLDCPIKARGDVHFSHAEIGDRAKISHAPYIELAGKCTYSLSGSWTDTINNLYNYTLVGSGNAEFTNAPGAYFGKIWSSYVYALPATISVDVDMNRLRMLGKLHTFNKETGLEIPGSPSDTYIYGHSAVDTATNMGDGYIISRDKPCTSSTVPQCLETLELKPKLDTIPTPDTKG